MKNVEPIAQILWHYIQNIELTADEKRALYSWLEKTKDRKILFDELSDRELWLQSIPMELKNNPEGPLIRIRELVKKIG